MLGRAEEANIREDFAAIRGLLERPVNSAEELTRHFREIYEAVYTVDIGRYDPLAVRNQARSLMGDIFLLRLALRDRIGGWHQQGFMSHDAHKALRDLFRAARYASDMLGELLIGYDRSDETGVPLRGFTGQHTNTFVNPRHLAPGASHVEFHSGDVVLVRGLLHNSAAIARIGDVDSQFSHVMMVYVDPAGMPWAVEALIEEGSVVNPMGEALDHHLGRAILYRFADPKLAAAAALFIHDVVKRSRQPGGRWIPYDFSMQVNKYKQLFCSKLVRYAFLNASKGTVDLPTFATRLDRSNRDFFSRIGVKAKTTFAPGDMEVEPLFDVVAEWQDYRVTSRLRLQDMMMTKFFEWMDRYGYTFKDTFTIKLIGWFGRLASHLSDDAKNYMTSLVPKIPPNMKRRTIATIVMLHKTAEQVYHRIEALELDSIAKTSRPLHPRDVYAALETIRAQSGGVIGYLVGKG